MTLTWPDTAILIAVTVIGSVVLHAVLMFAIRRIVRRIAKQGDADGTTFTSRAARVMARASGLSLERHRQRTETIGTLLRSVVTVVIYGVMLTTVLAILGIPMAPLLASAGIGGLAIGFGAQSLVKDVFTGLFIILEDQYGVGDVVRVGEVSGTVEEVTLRITKVRDPFGQAWYLRNGEITTVGNISQGWSTAIVDIPVANDEDPEKVIALLKRAADEVDKDPAWDDILLDAPTVVGVESVTATTMTIRMTAKCAPNRQFGLQRDLRERAVRVLGAEGVRMPLIPATIDPQSAAK